MLTGSPGLDVAYYSHKPECIGTTKPDKPVLITIIIDILILSHGCKYFPYGNRSKSRFACYVTYCRLAMPVFKGRRDHDALPYTFNIVFESGKKTSTTIKHIYN